MSENAQLRWRCRRGMRELDVLLVRYLEQRFDAAPEVDRQAFRQILTLPDPVLYAYLLGRETPTDRDHARVVAAILALGELASGQ